MRRPPPPPGPDPGSPPPDGTRPSAALRSLGLRPRRALSQSFLEDPGKQARIAEAAVPDPAWSVLEIGPGTGALTVHLAARARELLAVEADPDLAAAGATAFADRPHVRVVHGDARGLDFAALTLGRPLVVAGNIPYHLTGLLLARVLDAVPAPDRVVFLVQEEVALRLTAEPGTKAYGALTLLAGARWLARRALRVPRGCFRPVPKVDSAVVVFEPRPHPEVTPELHPRFRRLVQGAFSHRRKTLRNALLAAGFPRPDLDRLAAVPAVDLDRRPEQHPLDAWAAMARALGPVEAGEPISSSEDPRGE